MSTLTAKVNGNLEKIDKQYLQYVRSFYWQVNKMLNIHSKTKDMHNSEQRNTYKLKHIRFYIFPLKLTPIVSLMLKPSTGTSLEKQKTPVLQRESYIGIVFMKNNLMTWIRGLKNILTL